jgi:hypothetical protein
MAPKYQAENRYAFVIDATRELAAASYEVDTPETAFERDVQRRLVEANRLLASGRPAAALDAYTALRGVIAAVLYPKIPPVVGRKIDWLKLAQAGVADAVMAKSAQMLDRTPLVETAIPAAFLTSSALPAAAANVFAEVEAAGLVDADIGVRVPLAEMQEALEGGRFDAAAKSAAAAAAQAKDPELRAAFLHDQAVLQSRSGQAADALQVMQRSVDGFAATGKRDAQIAAMSALADMQSRGGDTAAATRTLTQADEVRKQFASSSTPG